MTEIIHQPVLLKETVETLNITPGKVLVDATVGSAGHSLVLSNLLGPTGRLIGLDADEEALSRSRGRLREAKCQVDLIRANFRDLGQVLENLRINQIDAVLFDLGFSSEEIESSGRGFSFQRDEPLLMTLANPIPPGTVTAKELVNGSEEKELADIIYRFGEERFARHIAKAIVDARRKKTIETTGELVAVIKQAVPDWYTHRRLHFATKTFQALRVAVNDEIGAIELGLEASWQKLVGGGVVAVITFQGLEGKSVKAFYKNKKSAGEKIKMRKSLAPRREEIIDNPRSRSARLRVIEKL